MPARTSKAVWIDEGLGLHEVRGDAHIFQQPVELRRRARVGGRRLLRGEEGQQVRIRRGAAVERVIGQGRCAVGRYGVGVHRGAAVQHELVFPEQAVGRTGGHHEQFPGAGVRAVVPGDPGEGGVVGAHRSARVEPRVAGDGPHARGLPEGDVEIAEAVDQAVTEVRAAGRSHRGHGPGPRGRGHRLQRVGQAGAGRAGDRLRPHVQVAGGARQQRGRALAAALTREKRTFLVESKAVE